ncbi:hypothetical protein [Streptomyces sp. NPDC055642]
MTLDIRPTDKPDRFDLYDGDDRIGEISPGELTEEDVAADEDPYWEVVIWSAMGTGKEWRSDAPSIDGARDCASECYQEFAAERRELSRGSRPPTVSTPMGGQRRR